MTRKNDGSPGGVPASRGEPSVRAGAGRIDRRAFLAQLATFGAAVAAFRCRRDEEPRGLELRVPELPGQSPPLSPAQRAALEAACDRMLPGDDGIPGARDAGVIDFAASELRRPELREIRKRVDGGLLALDRRAARASAGKRFVELDPAEQERILSQTQTGSLQGEQFLRILISLTLEGFLGDPSYGGNRDSVGWTLTGATPTSERGRLPPSSQDRAEARARELDAERNGDLRGTGPASPAAGEATR